MEHCFCEVEGFILVEPVQETKRVAELLAKGDLTEIMEGEYQGEFADLRDAINSSMSNLLEMVNKILDKYKRIDILINNAGITKDNLLLRMSEGEWDAVLSCNLKGVFCCTKAVTKAMLKAKKGKTVSLDHIYNI